MRLTVLISAVVACACVSPRSITLGQMAAPIGRGATEVGVYGGVGYGLQTNPSTTTTDSNGGSVTNQVQNRVFGLPAAEANIQRGFNEHVALNVHLSSAGVQPGLKWTVNKSRVAHFAILPAVGFGYASFGSTTFQAGADGRQIETAPLVTTSFTFLSGLKLLVSHKSGFYAGVGYDFLLNRSLTTQTIGTQNNSMNSEVLTVTLSHQIMGAVGIDIALGAVHLKPEVAFAVYPMITQTSSSKVENISNSGNVAGGYGWAILPGFSLSVQSPSVAKPDDEDEGNAVEHDGDDDDDDETPRARKRRTRDEDDEDEKPRRGKRKSDEDED